MLNKQQNIKRERERGWNQWVFMGERDRWK